jgi:hypothetical protein
VSTLEIRYRSKLVQHSLQMCDAILWMCGWVSTLPRNLRRTIGQPAHGAHQRSAERSPREPGPWEGDLLMGKGGTSAIATLVERSRRYVVLMALLLLRPA